MMDHYQSWIDLPKVQSSTLLKQGGIILTERGTKGNQCPKKGLWNVLQEAWRTTPQDYLKELQESLHKRVQAVLKINSSLTKYRL